MKILLIVVAFGVFAALIFQSILNAIYKSPTMKLAQEHIGSYATIAPRLEAAATESGNTYQPTNAKATNNLGQLTDSLLQTGALAEASFLTFLMVAPLLFSLKRVIE